MYEIKSTNSEVIFFAEEGVSACSSIGKWNFTGSQKHGNSNSLMKTLFGPYRITASLGDIVSLARSVFQEYISSFTFQFFRSHQNLAMSFSKLFGWL